MGLCREVQDLAEVDDLVALAPLRRVAERAAAQHQLLAADVGGDFHDRPLAALTGTHAASLPTSAGADSCRSEGMGPLRHLADIALEDFGLRRPARVVAPTVGAAAETAVEPVAMPVMPMVVSPAFVPLVELAPGVVWHGATRRCPELQRFIDHLESGRAGVSNSPARPNTLTEHGVDSNPAALISASALLSDLRGARRSTRTNGP